MNIESLCPFRVGTLDWASGPERRALTVIVKGTFALASGAPRLAPAQDTLGVEVRWDESAIASLYTPGDFAPLKRRVDVLLVGHAYAPQPVTSLVAKLEVGALSKSIRVVGDRRWVRSGNDLVPSQPEAFTQMPLRWERASIAGDNPVGVDEALREPGALARANLEAVEGSAPCFGPIAPTWRSRRNLLTENALFWAYGLASGRGTIEHPPPNFDFAYFNAAPRDQQIDLLKGGTPVALEGVNALHPRVETSLPKTKPQAFRVDASGRAEEVVLRCDTLFIDVDRGVFTLTWRGIADLDRDADAGTIVVAADDDGKKLRWEAVDRMRRKRATVPPEGAEDPLARRYDQVRGAPEGETYLPLPPVDDIAREKKREDATKSVPVETRPVLPFDRDATPRISPSDEQKSPKPRFDSDSTAAIAVDREYGAATPFEKKRQASANLEATSRDLEELSIARYYEKSSPAPRDAAAEIDAKTDTSIDVNAKRDLAPRESVAPPAREQEEELSLERVAELQAMISAKGAKRMEVLRAAGVEDAKFRAAESAWSKRIAEEKERGARELLDRHDAAYVDAQAKKRGRPVGVEEYAKVVVGVERGQVGKALADLELQLGDLMRLQRVWTKRTTEDPKLAAALASAVDAARKRS